MTGKRRLYIENKHGHPEVYWVTRERWAAAAARHRAAAESVEPVFAFDTDRADAALAEAEIAIAARVDPVRLKAHARKLRWIHSTSAGVENLAPFDWLASGATLTNSRGIHGPKAGEFGLMAIMLLNDNMPIHFDNQRRHFWSRVYSTPIAGKTVVILGMGNMGRAVAVKARALDVRVIGVRRDPAPDPVAESVVGPRDLHAVLPQADFLVVTTPLTPETRGMIGAREIALLRPTAGVVNMGRAAVMDYDALVAALRAEKLAGAVLDVFNPEPLPPESPLWDAPRVVIVPHVSSDDQSRYVDLALDLFFRNLESYLAGAPLPTRVDTTRGY
jgi:phosphoglycerate dehydrogenase-like enzyme